MHVLATAGHVDHGKSTLVRALTGMEPDRYAEERRRGMTIDLGFAWTRLPGGRSVAFVDVPGHERFVPTMLAGVGPAPAVVLVVAADEGWRAQSAEHLAALDAFGVEHGLLVVTRSDLADPSAAVGQATRHLAGTSLAGLAHVTVSAVTGDGLDDLRAALAALVAGLPAPDPTDDVRLWVDRSFAVRGAGTVVTGTLGAGTLRVGDLLRLSATGREVRVRALQTLGEPAEQVGAVARVAVNLRGVDQDAVRRGDALLQGEHWRTTGGFDARLTGDGPDSSRRPTTDLVLHLGTAAVPARVRPLADDLVRVQLAHPQPLRIGDRGLLREPSSHERVQGLVVLDPAPRPLVRRGAAARRAAELRDDDGRPAVEREIRRRGPATSAELRAVGVRGPLPSPVVGDWHLDPAQAEALCRSLGAAAAALLAAHPLDDGVSTGALRRATGLPDDDLVVALLPAGYVVRGGRVRPVAQPGLPASVARAVDAVRTSLGTHPFAAPEAHELRDLGLGRAEVRAAVRAGALLELAEGVVLLPDAPDLATVALAGLAQPFTVSAARQAWATSRRVALPLLALLDARGVTVPLGDGTRRLAGS